MTRPDERPDEELADVATVVPGDHIYTGDAWELVTGRTVDPAATVHLLTRRDGGNRDRTFASGEQVRVWRCDPRHPAWCDPGQCLALDPLRAYHRSAPAVLARTSIGQVEITAQAWQTSDEPIETAPASVVVTFDESALYPLVYSADLEPWQVRGLVDMLGPMLDAVTARGVR